MTFRIDDLLVAVLPEPEAKGPACGNCTHCTKPTGDPTGCTTPNTEGRGGCCCDDSGQAKKPKKARREEEFAVVAAQLEEVLISG
jgi:hypothetical protein